MKNTKRTQIIAFSIENRGLLKKQTHLRFLRPLVLGDKKMQNKANLNISLMFIESGNYKTKPFLMRLS
jgi:hypothetical protein